MVSNEEVAGTAGLTGTPFGAGIRMAIDYLRLVDEKDLKLVLKVTGVSTIEMQVEDDGKVISVDVVDPDGLSALIQQFRNVFMPSEE